MDFLKLLREGRVDDFKVKYGNKFSPEQLRGIVSSVPHKYLMWVGKTFDGINFEENLPKLSTALNKFEKLSTNLPKTDINQYQNLNELINAISIYENRERRDVRQVEGGNVIYDDGKFFVVNPLDHKASCYYGRGTKWCTAAETDTHFRKYNEDGKLFYIIDRTKPTSDPLYKVALLRKFNGEKIFYDAKDEYVKTGWIFTTEPFKAIDSAVDKYLMSEFKEQLKIFSDIELVKKEKERLRKLEIQRILSQRRNEANERRIDEEWDLSNPNIDEEGEKAHALLQYLVENENVEVITNEDKIEIQRIKDDIERLQTEYDESEDVRYDLLPQIEELEDELDNYSGRIDVYNIIPIGEYYNTTKFEVIDSDVDGNEYAVGTDDEMQKSCEEYVENLIDDIGYEGFSRNFVMNYIDDDAVIEVAEEIFEDDVRNNPESYLDESDRMLSSEQEEQISILKQKIEKSENMIENFENNLDGDNDDWFENKIEELRERIEEYEEEIESIEEDHEGDFPDELIEEQVNRLVDDVRRDTESFLTDYGLDWSNYIDKDEFIEGVIEADGYGQTINSYDGSADEIYIKETLFYVMRID